MNPNQFPSVSDVRVAWNSGPDGASLANRWMDALITTICYTATVSAASGARNHAPDTYKPAARPALASTDPERYGWRFWALRPDGILVSPFTGTAIDRGTFDAECRDCVRPPSPECGCGVHYVLRARDIIRYAENSALLPSKHPTVQRLRAREWAPALTYGVAIGAVEVDSEQYQTVDSPSRRATRWHMLAMLTPNAGPARRAQLRERYRCPVSTGVSLRACEAAAGRLESSLPPARMAELSD